jgi:flagellar motor component MotA
MADLRTIIFWLIGTICIFFGTLISGSVEPVVGSTAVSIVMAYGLSFILIMLGGMFWISTAIMQNDKDE